MNRVLGVVVKFWWPDSLLDFMHSNIIFLVTGVKEQLLILRLVRCKTYYML